jgi:hypothetical protein
MKKLLTLLFLLTALISNAQNLNKITGLESTAPAVAYSLRQLSTNYTGPLVRIKVGTSFYDVYPDASTTKFSLSSKISAAIVNYNDGVAAASASTTLNSLISGSTDATVAIWYDQSGNGVNVLNASALAKIITSGTINTMNGQPTINFTSANSYLTSSATVNYSSQTVATLNAAVQDVASTDYISGIISTGNNGGWGLIYDPTTTIKGYWVDASGGNGAFSNENTRDVKIVTGLVGKTTNSYIYVNSQLKGNRTAQSIAHSSADNIYVGVRGNASNRKFIGNISEVFMFPKTLTAAEQTALETSQSIFIGPSVTIASSASGAVCAGTSVTFTATTSNFSGTPTYQWTKNGIGIPSANSSTYSSTTLSNNDVIKVWVNAGINPSSIVSNGLKLNLDASNPGSYAGAGTTWYDLSGNNNHATLNNSPTYDAASASIVTNGTNQYISVPQISTSITNVTMQAWVYVNLNTKGPFIKNGTAGGGYAIGIGNAAYDQVGSNVNMLVYGSPGWINTGVSYGTAGWKLVTMTMDGSSTARAYVNGTLIGTYTTTPNASFTGALNFGANIGDQNVYYNGKFAAAYFYDRALSLAEIQQNYNAFATKTTAYSSNTITASITGSAPILTVTGDGCINKTTLSTPTGATAYAWYKDNAPISGATSNTYSLTTAGDYKVQVTSGSCASMSEVTTIAVCGVTADGRMRSIATPTTLVSQEGGVNFGTGVSEVGATVNATGLGTTLGTVSATTAVVSGVISSTNALTSSIGVIYSTDSNFGTFSTSNTQSNVASGTHTFTLSGLASTTTYHAKSFITNKAGTSYGPAVSFTTTAPPVVLGASYGGGIVVYLYVSGDAGYVAGETHGLIAATQNQVTGGSFANVNSNLNNPLYHDTAGQAYTDWRIPSLVEIRKIFDQRSRFGAFDYNSYYIVNVPATFTNSSSSFYAFDMSNSGSGTGFGYPCNLRAVRSF